MEVHPRERSMIPRKKINLKREEIVEHQVKNRAGKMAPISL